MALPQQHRLKSSRDFGKVHRKGQRAATQHLAVRALRRADPMVKRQMKLRGRSDIELVTKSADGQPSALSSCFGISISRKVSKRAVVRNRIKRQLKAVIRHYLPRIEPGWQVVIVVRAAAVECEFDDFLRELEYLLKKLRIMT
ncbi:MAG: ribonuclease P protein component [Phormidesmis sp.]